MQSNYWMNLRGLWTTFPTKQLGGSLKFYLLTSLAFWFNQIIVVNVEKKRNDYALYMAHHIVTATVMVSAYVYSAHELAHLVSNLMEAADVFLCVRRFLRLNPDQA
jgi:acyl-CoA-dependent ceramide synthase